MDKVMVKINRTLGVGTVVQCINLVVMGFVCWFIFDLGYDEFDHSFLGGVYFFFMVWFVIRTLGYAFGNGLIYCEYIKKLESE